MNMKNEVTKLLDQMLATLPKEALPILRSAFFTIRNGQTVSTETLSNLTNIDPKVIDSVLEKLTQRQMVVRGDDEKIVGALGLSLIPTKHRFQLEDRTLYTRCAADTLIFPAVLDADVDIQSHCAYNGEPIEITMRDGKLTRVVPESAVIWQVEADPEAPLAGGT
jgi:alkylmercury lyase